MNKQLDEKITKYLQANRESFIKDLQKLLSFDSVKAEAVDNKPFGEEAAKAIDYMQSLCDDIGLKTTNYDYYCMDASYGQGSEVVGALCHLDIVPAGEGWDYPPFEGKMEGSIIYGRGVCDDKGPAIAIFYALKSLIDAGVKMDKTIKLIFGSDEETGMSDMKYYLTKTKAPDFAFSPDADFPVIYAEKHVMGGEYQGKIIGSTNLISIVGGTATNAVPNKAIAKIKTETCPKSAEKISYSQEEGVLTITAKGIASHASLPDEGDNAIVTLLDALYEILPDDDGAKQLIKNLYDAMAKSNGSGMKIQCRDEVTGELTLNLGVIDYKDSALCAFFDIRHPVTLEYTKTQAMLTHAIDAFTLVKSYCSEGIHRPKDGLLVSTLQRLYKEITGDSTEPVAIGGGTYARCLPNAVAFGPKFPDGNVGGAHTINEYADIDELMKAARIYAHCLYSLATS